MKSASLKYVLLVTLAVGMVGCGDSAPPISPTYNGPKDPAIQRANTSGGGSAAAATNDASPVE